MNTYAKPIHRSVRNIQSRNTVIIAIVLALVTLAASVIYIANRSVVGAVSNSAVAYSNAMEMQYAQPWLTAHNKPVTYSNALELQYAQPWLQNIGQSIRISGGKISIPCQSSLEMLYACRYGYGQP